MGKAGSKGTVIASEAKQSRQHWYASSERYGSRADCDRRDENLRRAVVAIEFSPPARPGQLHGSCTWQLHPCSERRSRGSFCVRRRRQSMPIDPKALQRISEAKVDRALADTLIVHYGLKEYWDVFVRRYPEFA